MADYEQLEFDVRLESDRELQENVGLAVSFACKQMQQEIPKKIENRHEGYGVLAEAYAKLQASMKKVGEGFKHYALILPTDDQSAVEASNSIYNAVNDATYDAVKLAAMANKIMTDLYRNGYESTPIEDYLEEQGEEFEEAEEVAIEEVEEE